MFGKFILFILFFLIKNSRYTYILKKLVKMFISNNMRQQKSEFRLYQFRCIYFRVPHTKKNMYNLKYKRVAYNLGK